MSQKLFKAGGKRNAAAKRLAKKTEDGSVVLVGTDHEKQLDWIKKNGVYNYPVEDGDGRGRRPRRPAEKKADLLSVCAKVKELWLYAGAKTKRHCFTAEFIGIQSKAEFLAANPTYAKKVGKPSHAQYAVFKTKPFDYGPKLEGKTVVARAIDFAKGRGQTKKIVAAIKQFYADGEFAPLAAYLPKELGKVPCPQLRVCEAAVQLDFFCASAASVEKPAREMSLVKTSGKEAAHFIEGCKAVDAIRPFLNTIIQGDSAEELKKLPENSIDLVVTSPPYDQIRNYNGFTLDLHAIGEQLYRVVKSGGVVAMVIQDSTKNFAKTLTSFRTIVDWCDNIGFKMFETVIYHKNGTEGAWWTHRFRVDHEYMPIFFKGDRPLYFNKEPLKIPSKWGGKVMTGSGNRRTSGETTKTVTRPINLMKCRGTVWDYMMAGDKNPLKRKHPAVFPDKIPFDFIQCFCPPDGVVLDPFLGCGSTAVTAKGLGRNYIGIDISAEYCALAEERIRVDSCKYSQQVFSL